VIVHREFARVLQVIGKVVWEFSKSFARVRRFSKRLLRERPQREERPL